MCSDSESLHLGPQYHPGPPESERKTLNGYVSDEVRIIKDDVLLFDNGAQGRFNLLASRTLFRMIIPYVEWKQKLSCTKDHRCHAFVYFLYPNQEPRIAPAPVSTRSMCGALGVALFFLNQGSPFFSSFHPDNTAQARVQSKSQYR